jgi:hypothetical protein
VVRRFDLNSSRSLSPTIKRRVTPQPVIGRGLAADFVCALLDLPEKRFAFVNECRLYPNERTVHSAKARSEKCQ